MTPIYTAFYTVGTMYEREADRLRRSLDRLNLEHDLRPVESAGDWIANTKQTATHICKMLAKYQDRPVVQLDADAVVWRRPALFDDLPGVDVAVHYRCGHELLNGTVYFAPTAGARSIAELYRQLIVDSPGCTNEQTMLAKAIEMMGQGVNVRRIPAEYAFIPDIMAGDVAPDAEIVISHFQASRESRLCGGQPMANRAKWIADWESLQAELCS